MKAGKALAKMITTMLVVGGLLGGAQAASASDQRVEIDVDSAWMFMQQTGTETYNGYRMLVTPSGPLHLSGKIYPNGSFQIPADQFKLQTSVVQGSMLGDIWLNADGELDGNFNQGTGEMSLDFPAKLELEYTAGMGGLAKCDISGFDIEFATEGAFNPGVGKNFESGPFTAGIGKLLGGWDIPISELVRKGKEGTPDTDCDAVGGTGDDSFVGKLWMSAKAKVVDTTPPIVEPDPPVERPGPSISTRVKLSPAKRVLTAGKEAELRLRVENSLASARLVRVNLKTSNRKVSVRKSIVIKVLPNSAAVADITVKAGRNAKGKSRITATAEDQTSTATVTVKKAKGESKNNTGGRA